MNITNYIQINHQVIYLTFTTYSLLRFNHFFPFLLPLPWSRSMECLRSLQGTTAKAYQLLSPPPYLVSLIHMTPVTTLYNMLHTLFFPKLVRWLANPHWMKIKFFMFARPFSDLTTTWLSIVSFVPFLLICVLITLAFFIPQMCHAVLDFKIKYILFSLPRIFSPVPPASSIRHLPSKFYPCFTAWLKFHDPMEVWFLTLDWDRPPFNQLT